MPADFRPDQPEFYLGDPDPVLKRLRREDPLPWYDEGNFWSVLTHSDLQHVSRLPRIFSSAHGTQLFEVPKRTGADPVEIPEGAQSIIRMDPPEHNRHRKLVIKAFTPRIVNELEPRIRAIANQSLDAIEPGTPMDFVESIAVPMPMLVIAELVGVPTSDRADFRRWSDAMVEAGGGGITPETVSTLAELHAYFANMLAERRSQPREDLISLLVAAELDGEKLSDPEIIMFLLTLLVAGNETTRNLISVGTLGLLAHPDQMRAVVTDSSLVPNAVEELLRWVTPVRTFVRRVMEDTSIRDKKLREGEYVVLLYGSVNRDERVFGEDVDAIDVRRASAPRHLAFGFGEHLCMGASLARLEAQVLFEQLFSRWPQFDLAGPVKHLPSVLMNGLTEMPVVFKA